jgi:outer membrane lipoprotein-sorting protein
MSRDDLHNRTLGDANGDGGAADAVDALLDRVTAAVRDLPVPDGPDEQTLTGTLAALRAAQTFPIHQNRKRHMKPLIKLAIAACVALIAGVVFFVAEPFSPKTLAFAKVLEQVQQAKSLQFHSTITIKLADKEQTVESTMKLLGNRLRQEVPASNLVSVLDFEKGELLSLLPQTKEAIRIKMENIPEQQKKMNLIEEFRNMKAEQAKDLGERELDGRKVHAFLVEQPGTSMTIFADPKTREPVRMEAKFEMPSVPMTTTVFKDFKWDAPVAESEVSLEVPEGYQVRSMTMDASAPSEKDLIEGLRILATFNDGTFPTGFDVAGMGEAFKVYQQKISPKTQEEQKAFANKMMPAAMTVGRAIAAINPLIGDDWHYAGKGAKLDETDRPVLWYKPAKSDKYRVIYADLTVKEVTADALPKIESKKLTAGASPFVAPAAPKK